MAMISLYEGSGTPFLEIPEIYICHGLADL